MSTPCTCGCCGGPHVATPADTWNAPGQTALRRRIGTYGSFLDSMRAELSSNSRPGLAPLRSRDASDPALALADAWAVVSDVLTFYQERLSNEGYLRTATERRSVVEIGNLIGYRPRPGVSASVHLAYTLDDKSAPVEIPAGSKAQNVPDPGEQMQTFETSEPLQARVEWNQLKPQRTLPLSISFVDALTMTSIRLTGAPVDLKAGDRMLFAFTQPGKPPLAAHLLRRVAKVTPVFDAGATDVDLEPRPRLTRDLAKRFAAMHDETIRRVATGVALDKAAPLLTFFDEYALGAGNDEMGVLADDVQDSDIGETTDLQKQILEWAKALGAPVVSPPAPSPPVDPRAFIALLDRPAVRVSISGTNLARSVESTFRPQSDVAPQLLTRMRPRLTDTYYEVWRNIPALPPAPPKPVPAPAERAAYANVQFDALHVFRNTSGLFGRRAPMRLAVEGQVVDNSGNVDDKTDPTTAVSLEDVDDGVAADSYVLIDAPESGLLSRSALRRRFVGIAESVSTLARNSYFLQGNTTRITVVQPGSRDALKWFVNDDTRRAPLSMLRTTTVLTRSERLKVAEPPDDSSIDGKEIDLDGLYDGLQSGRWLIVVGERDDLKTEDGIPIPNVEGRELMMLAGVSQRAIPGGRVHTVLTFERALANSYKRSTLVIYANVVKATHGETHDEPLGSGNAAQTLQSFTLKHDPLTYVAAPTPEGVVTTLEARVNLVRWREVDTLASAAPPDRVYTVSVQEDGTTALTFGTGEHGARLPTGVANVRAKYRSGIGKPGNVKADSITLLASRPLGVREVINPLRASGGADAEDRDHVRANAPLAVAALDRLIGIRDYADFARTFAGIGHADARRLSDGVRDVVHVTVAGIDDVPIDETSDLLTSLADALKRFGDSAVFVQVHPRELLALVVSANIIIHADYLWDDVAARVRAALGEAFSFAKRGLGQPAYLSEAMAAMQSVAGVVAVDIDVFDAVSELELADPEALKKKLIQLTGGDPERPQPQTVVTAARARRDDRPAINRASRVRPILPAQLAFIVPEVPDTVILNRR